MSQDNLRGWSLVEQALQEAKNERTPDLTLDLPHGQKIVIGRLSSDTILEIATWKGLGAPDENAVRLLLGATVPTPAENTQAVSSNEELLRVTGNTQTDMPVIQEPLPVAPTYVRRSESVRSMREENKKSHTLRNSLIGFFGTVLVIAGAIFGLAATNTLLFVHPQAGPDLPIGNAVTSIVAVSPTAEVNPGDLAMIDIDGRSHLVRVEAKQDTTILIQSMDGRVQIEQEQLTGRISFIVPFIGAPWLLFHN